MKKHISGTDKINKLCMEILKVTDDDIAEARGVAKQQAEYNSPLKMATVGWQRDLSDHNTRVLDAFCNLQAVIRGGEEIHQP